MAATGMLREYGAAIRDDWSTIDGREVRFGLDEIADWIDHPDAYPGDQIARGHLDLCPAGNGHWTRHCDPGWTDHCGRDCSGRV